MTPQATLSRRNLIVAAAAAGAAWLGGRMSFLPDRAAATAESGSLAALCADLHCPKAIRTACLRALPAAEASPEPLAALILAGLSSAGRACMSPIALRHAIGTRSRHDFRNGKIANVDGWMLSLTETRLYALSALLANDGHFAGDA